MTMRVSTVSMSCNFRQRKLEEVLLLSGKFQDALQERLNWLYKVEPMLAENQPVHGDVHTVNSFIEEHKVNICNKWWLFQKR